MANKSPNKKSEESNLAGTEAHMRRIAVEEIMRYLGEGAVRHLNYQEATDRRACEIWKRRRGVNG